MKKKNKYSFNDYFELFLYILSLVCFVYFFLKEDTAKTLQPVLIVATLIFIRIVIKITKVEIFEVLRFSILAFIFVAMFLANEFGFYAIIPGLDKIEHLFSGVILCFVGLLILKRVNGNGMNRFNPITVTLFSLFFAVAMAGCWEIYEYTTDKILGLKSQNESLEDTMRDIICGTLGAVVTTIYIYKRLSNNRSFFK
jgi:uncharacterized membrane protein YjdF